jgi:hypothetical protein
MNHRQEIVAPLKRLDGTDGITVDITASVTCVTITHQKMRSLDFIFRWSINHFIGYVVDGKGNMSQAVLSLWSSRDAAQFAESYRTLLRLRAGRRGTYYWFGSRVIR